MSRLIAFLLLLQGVILLTTSIAAQYGIDLGLARYQQSTGRLIRALNLDDQQNFLLLQKVQHWVFPLRLAAAFLIGGGITAFWRPHWLKPLWNLLRSKSR